MKNNKETLGKLLEGLLWSIFIGVAGISMGLGALYPPLNYVAKPFVCPTGQMNFETLAQNATPNQTFYSAKWTCTTDADAQPISPFLPAGVIYGLLCFPVFLWGREYFKKLEKA
jgi:hypothetical protein